MKLPNAGSARVEREKLEAYLLSWTHPVGRSKAKFFLSVGYGETAGVVLERALLEVARSGDVAAVDTSAYGVKYVVGGVIRTPSGRQVNMRTIWIVETGVPYPRLVTAYPF